MFQMYKYDAYKYKKSQCYIINPENMGSSHSHQSRFVFVKNNEIIAVANYMLVTTDVEPKPFTYYNLIAISYDYLQLFAGHIEGVGFDISYSEYSLMPACREHKEPKYFSFHQHFVSYRRNPEYIGGIFVKDNKIACVVYPLNSHKMCVKVDLDFTENNINHIASVYFGIDHKIVICGYELPSEKQPEAIEAKANVSIDDQIFNAFMNRG